MNQLEIHFGGATYDPQYDGRRLVRQLDRVMALMSDGRWRTLREIAFVLTDASEAGISARLRDLRKRSFGGYSVERRRRGDARRGVYEYRVSR